MTPSAPGPLRRPRSRVLATLRALIRARITAGLLTILPFMITIWLLWVVFGWFRDVSLWVLDLVLMSPLGRELLKTSGVATRPLAGEGLRALPVGWQWAISLLSIFLTVLLLYIIGLFAANIIGRRVIEWFDYIVGRVPLVKSLYGALKQIVALFSSDQAQSYQRVALVPFPNALTRSVAFITSTFRDAINGEELCAAFIPSTPNPTTGFVFVIRRRDIIEVDWTVETAVKTIMSGGIIAPPSASMVPGPTPGAPRLNPNAAEADSVRPPPP